MKVVILAGGFGTRISEESSIRPKPLVEIGGRPIIWHIMKTYSHFGLNNFIICCGYKGEMLKEYFQQLMQLSGEVTFDFGRSVVKRKSKASENWIVTLADTGPSTMTGGRLARVRHLLEGRFCLTYGDGVGDINIRELIQFHERNRVEATVTAVLQPGRFGALQTAHADALVTGFREKRADDGGYVNGGYFVLEPSVIDLVDSDDTVWELEPMQRLIDTRQLGAFHHKGFWQPMDTLRDKNVLEELWRSGKPPWKVWD